MAIAKRLVRYSAQRPASRLPGRGGGSSTPAPTLTFLQGVADAANGTEYTFSAQSLGEAASDRLIVVCVHGRATTALAVSSVTVAGVAATAVVAEATGSPASSRLAIYVAAVPTGTTGDVVVTFSAGALRAAVQMYRMTGVSATASATVTNADDPPSGSLSVTTGNVVIAASNSASSSANTCTWTSVTEDYDSQIGAEQMSVSSASKISEATESLAITAAWATPLNGAMFVAAAWGPA